jgi:hypothetical protein
MGGAQHLELSCGWDEKRGPKSEKATPWGSGLLENLKLIAFSGSASSSDMARPGIVTAVTTASSAAAGPVEDHGNAIQAKLCRCQDRPARAMGPPTACRRLVAATLLR